MDQAVLVREVRRAESRTKEDHYLTAITAQRQPIYLFSDSRGLFYADRGVLYIERIRHLIERAEPRAAYIGAANDDSPEFYAIFAAAMNAIGVRDCKLIRASLPEDERTFLSNADIVLLPGGDIAKCSDMLGRTGAKELLIRKHDEGCVLIGVSAGSVVLGMAGLLKQGSSSAALLDTLQLVPFLIDVHDEENQWQQLGYVIRLLGGSRRGIGIPRGGGLVYHPDHSLEVVSKVLSEFSCVGEELIVESCWPGEWS